MIENEYNSVILATIKNEIARIERKILQMYEEARKLTTQDKAQSTKQTNPVVLDEIARRFDNRLPPLSVSRCLFRQLLEGGYWKKKSEHTSHERGVWLSTEVDFSFVCYLLKYVIYDRWEYEVLTRKEWENITGKESVILRYFEKDGAKEVRQLQKNVSNIKHGNVISPSFSRIKTILKASEAEQKERYKFEHFELKNGL